MKNKKHLFLLVGLFFFFQAQGAFCTTDLFTSLDKVVTRIERLEKLSDTSTREAISFSHEDREGIELLASITIDLETLIEQLKILEEVSSSNTIDDNSTSSWLIPLLSSFSAVSTLHLFMFIFDETSIFNS